MREPTSNHDAVDKLRESTLPHIERAVLTEIAWHWPKMWPSINRIARHTGLGRTTTIEALHRLKKQGVIEVISANAEKGQGRANRYLIHWYKLEEAKAEDTRTVTTRLRQELAEAQRALWDTVNPDLVREPDHPNLDLVRLATRPSTAGDTTTY